MSFSIQSLRCTYNTVTYIHGVFPLAFPTPCYFPLHPFAFPSTYLAPSSCDRNRPPPSQVACKLTPFAPLHPIDPPFPNSQNPTCPAPSNDDLRNIPTLASRNTKHNPLLARHTTIDTICTRLALYRRHMAQSPWQFPFAWKIPPLFLIPFYLLGIPPLRVVRFPSTLVPGCLCTDLPPLSFSPSPFSLSPTVHYFKFMPSYDDITTSASHSPIQLAGLM